MKNAYKLARIAALALTIVFSFVSCDTGGSGPETSAPPQKSIKITGVTGSTIPTTGYDFVRIKIFSDVTNPPTTLVAESGAITINNGALESPLVGFKNNLPWTDSGEYFIVFTFVTITGYDEYSDGITFVYTDGATPKRDLNDAATYKFTETLSTIDLSKFEKFTDS